jgi:hypothetical protein
VTFGAYTRNESKAAIRGGYQEAIPEQGIALGAYRKRYNVSCLEALDLVLMYNGLAISRCS